MGSLYVTLMGSPGAHVAPTGGGLGLPYTVGGTKSIRPVSTGDVNEYSDASDPAPLTGGVHCVTMRNW